MTPQYCRTWGSTTNSNSLLVSLIMISFHGMSPSVLRHRQRSAPPVRRLLRLDLQVQTLAGARRPVRGAGGATMMARWKFRRAECGTVWPAARPSFTPTAGHSIFWTLVFAAIGIPIAFFVLQTIWRKEIDLAGFLKGP